MQATSDASAESDGLLPGFDDPVQGAQQAFRAILQAMARPGTVQSCGAELSVPAPLGEAMAAVCLTLADADAPLWLSSPLRTAPVERYLKFQCNAPLHDAPNAASFALADAAGMPRLNDLASGDDRYPDRSATLLVEVPSLTDDGGWTLRGPGIETTARLAVEGLPSDFAEQWRQNGELFPQGVDVVFTCGARLAALPRTTRLEG